jgi:hypothetical protein
LIALYSKKVVDMSITSTGDGEAKATPGGHLEKRFSRLTMVAMTFAILK